MRAETREFILTVIRDVINIPLPDRVEDDLPLGEEGLGLESLAMIELVLQLEGEYGVELQEDELTADLVPDLGALVDTVVGLRSAAAAGSVAR
ncbi:acyl carrier protein [Saccharothrix tamanrassetensis]|uniref:Acyl carrier protein n=1 Tax=Saccharothrix tamanrassetensis TaxID=1051531 RepID=A0A841CR62_9PSEU|nr:acyl carrier protein [Saccharothrix tamanrassetensis]MBB5959720.1 acyl carrier protein [Saccharothrix tamanrassetensis]